jgi:hypothetical protein
MTRPGLSRPTENNGKNVVQVWEKNEEKKKLKIRLNFRPFLMFAADAAGVSMVHTCNTVHKK